MTSKIRTGFVVGLLLLILPLSIYYQHSDLLKQKALEALRIERLKFSADSLAAENLRRDSLHYYLLKAQRPDPQLGFGVLKKLGQFASTPQEKDTIKLVKKDVSRRYAKSLIRQGKDKAALGVYSDLLIEQPEDADILYDRANYYVKVGKIKSAVADLTRSIKYGGRYASKLYNKINPLRRRVAYYVTRCCDGTTSNATGRGACSWHGGVCNWNEPVYEEYRKY